MVKNITYAITAFLVILFVMVPCTGFDVSTSAEPVIKHEQLADTQIIASTESPTVIPIKTAKPQKVIKKPAYFTEVKDGKITTSSLKSICKYVGKKYDIDADLLRAIVFVESDYQVNCDGISGDKGLCQIVERFHTERMKKLHISDIYDPYSNVLLCADFLTELRTSKYGGDIYFVLMAYNMGLSGATKHYEDGKISEYAYKVMDKYENLKGDD